LTVRTAVVDRADLRAEIVDGYFGVSDNALVEVRLYNRGRRPIKVEELGWAARKGTTTSRYPYWFNWSSGKERRPELPIALGEADSDKVWTWPASVAEWMLRLGPPGWLWARDSLGETHWYEAPPNIVNAIRSQWPEAERRHATREAEAAQRREEVAAKEARGEPPLDDYGHPIDTDPPAGAIEVGGD
jgi:hypothetical protein